MEQPEIKKHYTEMILGYTRLMIECAENLAKHGNNKDTPETLYFKFLRAPAENQDIIREKLNHHVPGINIPDWAFVVFTEHHQYGKAFVSNSVTGPGKHGKIKPDTKLGAIYELNQKVQAFGTFGSGEAEEPTDGLHKICRIENENLKDYSVLLVYPYYGVSIVEIKFQDGEEIVLSSC